MNSLLWKTIFLTSKLLHINKEWIIIRMIRYDEILYPNHFKYPLYQKNRDLLGLCYFWCWIQIWIEWTRKFRSSPAEVFLRKGVLKICSKFTREHPCRSVISVKLLVRSKRSSATGFAKKINSKRKSLAINVWTSSNGISHKKAAVAQGVP